MTPIRLTHPTALILRAIAAGHLHGFDIMEVSGLPSGTVYPALRRLEREGALASQWEESPGPGPRRRVYRLTAEGGALARTAEARLAETHRVLSEGLVSLEGAPPLSLDGPSPRSEGAPGRDGRRGRPGSSPAGGM
jgi:DNA-binding PadR family transcriptional regulator